MQQLRSFLQGTYNKLKQRNKSTTPYHAEFCTVKNNGRHVLVGVSDGENDKDPL